MIFNHIFSDDELKEEFLDKFANLAPPKLGGLQALDAIGPDFDEAAAAVASMQEGSWTGENAGLEAIIQRFTRPVYMVRDSTFGAPDDDFEDSEMIESRLRSTQENIELAIPSVGRIDLRNHRMGWVGTGWMVAPDMVATNRHVAEVFARQDDDGFAFRQSFENKKVRATVDWIREHRNPAESLFRVKEVLHIEPEPSFDVALLRVDDKGEDDQAQPSVIDLCPTDRVQASLGRWIGIIGYPARDSRNDLVDQQRIFDGIYDVKRLAPGKITSVRGDGLLEHDATTLGGASGSVVLDVDTGTALGIHFGGIQGQSNFAVGADRLSEIIKDHT